MLVSGKIDYESVGFWRGAGKAERCKLLLHDTASYQKDRAGAVNLTIYEHKMKSPE